MARLRAERVASTPARALVDSGPLVALFNGADHWHARIVDWLREHPGCALVTTWPVLTEVCALLARRVGNAAALDFLQWVQLGAVEVDRPTEASPAQVLTICRRFASLPLDLADASIAETAARRGLRHVLTLDPDFDVYRNRAGKPLVSVLVGA